MPINYISNSDVRYNTLKKGFNLRWPDKDNSVLGIYICSNEQEVLDAANKAAYEGKRITVRSGGHCYEGFVSNNNFEGNSKVQDTVIIDIGAMTGVYYDEIGFISKYETNKKIKNIYKFQVSAGNQNWDSYVNLYKLSGKTIPGGSCYSVGLGGHITGGGYGLLSRKQGLTVDWLAGIDILVPNDNCFKVIHVSKRSQDDNHKRLFKACCGAGGGNFGIILNYYFDDLPDAPSTAAFVKLTYKWDQIPDQIALQKFLDAYLGWFKQNDQYWNDEDEQKCNGGLFTLLKLHHKSAGDIELVIQYTGKDGTYKKGINDAPLLDFIHTMQHAANKNLVTYQSAHIPTLHGPLAPQADCIPLNDFYDENLNLVDPPIQCMDWLYLTQTLNGSGDNQYGKYKSVYQKSALPLVSVTNIYESLTGNINKSYVAQSVVQIDSYGGCINQADKNQETSVYQRASLLKWQFQNYWKDPDIAEHCIDWIHAIYSGCFSIYGSKPYEKYNGKETPFQGCYINYPDVDMKYIGNIKKEIDPNWLILYYGEHIAKELIEVKNIFDKNNVFRHEMSIPLTNPQPE
ncbi:MAG: BBE domain-containing protein [Enterobacteriaceae bacterium]|jgi:hypothetical protein|nr:BBE domain-containing protein [Enterobacteriaceae bacterium]